jgi:glutamate-ammonia-ligase adenylyltransferase
MDALIDPAFFGAMPRADEIGRQIDTLFADARSYEECLDRARIVMQERNFLIGVRVLTNTATTLEASEAYADLADTVLDRLFARVVAELAETHGVIEGGGAAVVAMGKLGGREMTASSDLDLLEWRSPAGRRTILCASRTTARHGAVCPDGRRSTL